MKVNSINTLYNNYSKLSFKHTAVPYPEYESAYYNSSNGFSALAEKLSQLFSPKVSKETINIKSKIDSIYEQKSDKNNLNPKKQLLSVLA